MISPRLLFTGAALLAASTLAADETLKSARDLLLGAIQSPGSYSQTCRHTEPPDRRVPIPIYRPLISRDFQVSEAQLSELRKRRAEVIPELKKMLSSIDPTTPSRNFAASSTGAVKSDVVESGISPSEMSGLTLDLVVGLNAIEALPELLQLESQFQSGLGKATSDSSVQPPVTAGDTEVALSWAVASGSHRALKMLQAQVAQRELLGAVLKLLRDQRYQPLLDSVFEKTYAAAVREDAKDKRFNDLKTRADAEATGIDFDSILQVPLPPFRRPATIPFTLETRDSIRALATDFLKTVPPEKWIISGE